MTRVALAMLACLLGLCSASCQGNPYSQFYDGIPDARALPGYDSNDVSLQIYSTDNFDQDRVKLMRRGYMPIGHSSFNAGAGNVSRTQLEAQARQVGAHIVLTSSNYTHTVTGSTPIVLPNNTTSYTTGTATAYGGGMTVSAYGSGVTNTYGTQTVVVPYSVRRSDFGALYFVKQQSRVGIVPEELDDNTRRRLERNTGLAVQLVQDGSPAFDADILPGDVLLSINAIPIASRKHYLKLLDEHEGATISLVIDRNGKSLEKHLTVRTNSKPPQPPHPAKP